MYPRSRYESDVSSRIEDLRDLARMLDEGKISQREYDIVKADLIRAPAEEWLAEAATSPPASTEEIAEGDYLPDVDETEPAGWLATIRDIPVAYRAALVGAVLVLVVGGFIASRGDASGTVAAATGSQAATIPSLPPEESIGVTLDQLVEAWNAVEHPPTISGGITTSPEPGPLDSFLHRFNDSAFLAGAYDPSTGHISALMASASLHYEAVSNVYVHLCYLLHPGSQPCLEVFIEETGLFGKSPADLIGTEQVAAWEFEDRMWRVEIADDVETIRIQASESAD
jgi:hypothetical protein